ncbi:MAG: FRG domain-containing protein [Thermodesulfobacteriota bacterium]
MPRLQTKVVQSLEAYISLVEGFRGKGGGTLWYRGCGRIRYELRPSLYRHKRSRTIEDFMRLEKLLISRFQQRSIPFHSRSLVDPWEWVFLMQHYGVPTRLLDWSESPLMALFFAVTSAPHILGAKGKPVFAGDAAVWVLDPKQWNKRAVDLRSFPGSILTTDDPNAIAYKPIGDINTMKAFPVAVYGAHNSQRIVAQRGVFVCFGKDTRSMESVYERESFPAGCLMKIALRKGKLPSIHEALRRHGLTDSVVFPDLDGLAREIKREFAFEV